MVVIHPVAVDPVAGARHQERLRAAVVTDLHRARRLVPRLVTDLPVVLHPVLRPVTVLPVALRPARLPGVGAHPVVLRPALRLVTGHPAVLHPARLPATILPAVLLLDTAHPVVLLPAVACLLATCRPGRRLARRLVTVLPVALLVAMVLRAEHPAAVTAEAPATDLPLAHLAGVTAVLLAALHLLAAVGVALRPALPAAIRGRSALLPPT